MAKHNHKHSESHRQAKRDEGETSSRKLHKDWRVWLAVGIMLAAMIMYVLYSRRLDRAVDHAAVSAGFSLQSPAYA